MTETETKPPIVGVRFSKVGKVYHFSAENDADIKVGDMVVVETSRGWQLGQVAQIIQDAVPPPEGWKEIDRRATPRDLLLRQMWQQKEADVISAARSRSEELRLHGVKIISAEYSFDGARLIILYSTETEEKYDLKSLRQDMGRKFAPSQVELRQIGPRDVAKVLCGMGACGLETRCCCMFLTEFSSISIRMAKEQGISLTPTEITGMCGRLRCCLIYEYDTYVEARSKLPKRNKRVRTPKGDGKVVDIAPLRGSVMVEIPEVGVQEFAGDEIFLINEAGVVIGQPPAAHEKRPSEIDQAVVGDEDDVEVRSAQPPPAPESTREERNTQDILPATRPPQRGDSPHDRQRNRPRPQDAAPREGSPPQDSRPGDRERQRRQQAPGQPPQQPGGKPGNRWKNKDRRSAPGDQGQRSGGSQPQNPTGGNRPKNTGNQQRRKGRPHDGSNEPGNTET